MFNFLINKKYRNEIFLSWKNFFLSSRGSNKFSKINSKLRYLNLKKEILSRNKLAHKKIFFKTISERSKCLNQKRVLLIKNKFKNGEVLSSPERNFLKNERDREINLFKSVIFKSFLYSILITYLLITLYPFLWSIFSSFKSDLEISNGSFNPFPEKWTSKNYSDLFDMGGGLIKSWIFNSFIVAFFGTLGNVIFNTFAGYSLARIKMPGRNKILWTFLALMMVPGQVGLIPNYILLKSMGMTNTLSALIIPAFVNISFIFMSRQFFLKFPKDIEEASRIDGQNRIVFIFRTVLPLMKPMIMTQAVFSFMGFWNNFMVAKMYIDTQENFTLTVGIQSLLERDANKVSYGQILAGSSISIFPILLLYTILNSSFMNSSRMDGNK